MGLCACVREKLAHERFERVQAGRLQEPVGPEDFEFLPDLPVTVLFARVQDERGRVAASAQPAEDLQSRQSAPEAVVADDEVGAVCLQVLEHGFASGAQVEDDFRFPESQVHDVPDQGADEVVIVSDQNRKQRSSFLLSAGIMPHLYLSCQ